jgi:hypothetical protein
LNEAAKELSVFDLKHRGAAIERSKRPLVSLDGEAMVQELFATLYGPACGEIWQRSGIGVGKRKRT